MKNYPSYSVAIRTLGTAGERYIRTLKSIQTQILQPEKIVVYIADGYTIPKETIGVEEYVFVKKGMISQRALQYGEIKSDYLLLLDDDVELESDSVKKLFDGLMQYPDSKCISANVFPNHTMTLMSKFKSLVLYGVFPRRSDGWAFKVHSAANYSYNNNPKSDVLPTQSFSGPVILINKQTFLNVHFNDECWMDQFDYALGDDQLLAQKLFINGDKILVHYNSGIKHLDAKTGQKLIKNKKDKIMNNIESMYIVWYRSIYELSSRPLKKSIICISYILFSLYRFLVYCILGLIHQNINFPKGYLKGLWLGYNFCKTQNYKNLPKFQVRIP